jgi:hypothetical protein
MKLLPDSLTAQQAETLTKRIVLKCKYFPSIAEIMEEYYLYSKELHKGKVLQFPEVRRTYDGRTAKKLHAISEFVKKNKKFPKPVVEPGNPENAIYRAPASSAPYFGPLEYRSTRRKPKYVASSHLPRSIAFSVRSAEIPLPRKNKKVLVFESLP